ncbi:MAG: shikimate dehydrogenase [Myxococcales bacterium]|nr:shikimate dehydrogenase [Myxococcales bacterium]
MTRVFGIFGWPVAHSRSPRMHNRAFAELGLDALYVPYAVPPERLPQALEAARALGVEGLNITLPHKEAIAELLDEVTPGARAIGAVNTVVLQGRRAVGHNTDATGLARSLVEAGVQLQGNRVTMIGAGGAARAAAVGLSEAGAARVYVAARRPDQAAALVAQLSAACPGSELAHGGFEDLPAEFEGTDLLIQATSATLGEGQGATAFAQTLPLEHLGEAAVVCDLVYKPRRTSVLARAEARGLRTVDGLGMLLYQGVLAFELFTGAPAPTEAMAAALFGEAP